MIVLGELSERANSQQYYLVPFLVQISSTEATRRLATEAIAWGNQLHREAIEYRDTFPENVNHSDENLLTKSRAVTSKTRRDVRQPVLVRDVGFSLSRARVIEVLQNGRVKLRPSHKNSRWDRVVTREKILLSPADLKPYEGEIEAWRAEVSPSRTCAEKNT